MILDAILGPARSLAGDPFDDKWYGGASLGRQTAAGVRVDDNTAMNYSVCWAATRLLAGTSGWLPFNLYKKRPGGGADIASQHRVHRMIHDAPNRDMGAMMFRCRGVGQQVNQGNCFAEIVRTKGGFSDSLEPIHPRRIPQHNIKRENGRLVYYVNREDGGKAQRIDSEDMFHVPSMMSDDGIYGKGVIANAREAIGKAIGTQRRGASAIMNGGAPPLALKGGKFKDKTEREEYRRQINEVHAGPENAGKWLLLPTDSEVEKLGFSLEDSQFIESEQFDVEELCRWYGVPPHLVQSLLRATFNNIEELGISFVKYHLIQWLKLWEQEVWRKLLTKQEQETHYAKFVVDALERGNLASRTEAGVKKFFNGLWSLNDWASQEDMNPIDETVVIDGETVALGDMHFVQQAMIPLAQAAQGQQPNPTDGAQGQQPNPTDELRQRMDTYGIGVRAGAITPQTDDEEQFRQEAGLPPMSADAKSAWEDDDGIRRPITLRDPNGAQTFPGQQPKAPPDDSGGDSGLSAVADRLAILEAAHKSNGKPADDGLAAMRTEVATALAAVESTRATQKQLATAMLRDVMSRMVSLEVNAVKRVAEKPNKFTERLKEFYDKHTAALERNLAEPVAVCLAAKGDNRESAGVVRTIAAEHVAESLKQLDALLDCTADELASKVDACVAKWHEERTVKL